MTYNAQTRCTIDIARTTLPDSSRLLDVVIMESASSFGKAMAGNFLDSDGAGPYRARHRTQWPTSQVARLRQNIYYKSTVYECIRPMQLTVLSLRDCIPKSAQPSSSVRVGRRRASLSVGLAPLPPRAGRAGPRPPAAAPAGTSPGL
jgi:hypothetical protein